MQLADYINNFMTKNNPHIGGLNIITKKLKLPYKRFLQLVNLFF